jgi:hypothetical protein
LARERSRGKLHAPPAIDRQPERLDHLAPFVDAQRQRGVGLCCFGRKQAAAIAGIDAQASLKRRMQQIELVLPHKGAGG